MSTERLDELGVPRRAFLKKAAAAAIAAPVIVSFGMDAIAEGSTRKGKAQIANQTYPNQCYANSSYEYDDEIVTDIGELLAYAVAQSAEKTYKPIVSPKLATEIFAVAFEAVMLDAAGECTASDKQWEVFIRMIKGAVSRLGKGLSEELIEYAEAALGPKKV